MSEDDATSKGGGEASDSHHGGKKRKVHQEGVPLKINVLVPKKTSLRSRLHCDDELFLDFLRALLDIDPYRRLSAKEALQHPWMTETQYEI